MSKVRSGFNKETKEHIMTGAGDFFKNFIVGVDTYESAKAGGKLLGATQGGGEFKAVATVRQIEIDGVAGRAKGLEVIDAWEISQVVNLIETTSDVLKLALGAASIDSTSNGSYHLIKGKSEITEDDYIDNITYVGTITGSTEPVIIQIYNALSTDGLDVKTEDKKEAVISVTVYGHYTEDDLDSPPFAIYYPKKGNISTPVASIKGGQYSLEQSVELTCAVAGTEIYYTTNGFEPTKNDKKYSTAITISENTILKAKAFKNSETDSYTMTETYIIGE